VRKEFSKKGEKKEKKKREVRSLVGPRFPPHRAVKPAERAPKEEGKNSVPHGTASNPSASSRREEKKKEGRARLSPTDPPLPVVHSLSTRRVGGKRRKKEVTFSGGCNPFESIFALPVFFERRNEVTQQGGKGGKR